MYTSVPRTILWLIPGGEHPVLDVEGFNPDDRIVVEPFYLGKLPVTNEQYEAFDPAFDRSPDASRDDDPALGVGFEEARDYCRWYAEISRKPMRLPRELEWEYASCGGEDGTRDPTPTEVDAMAWHAGNCSRVLPPLVSRKANGFGLYGMLGGIREWTTGAGPGGGPSAVLRGRSWRQFPVPKPAGCRQVELEGLDGADIGFRVAKPFR